MRKIIEIIFIITIISILFNNNSFAKEKVHLVTTPIMRAEAIILESDGELKTVWLLDNNS